MFLFIYLDGPKHKELGIIYLNTNESKLLNCTPEYGNPEVENYFWVSKTKAYDIPKINGPFILYNQSSEIDEVHITCMATNSQGHSLIDFHIKQAKGKS